MLRFGRETEVEIGGVSWDEGKGYMGSGGGRQNHLHTGRDLLHT
jgi:hypothetical protein